MFRMRTKQAFTALSVAVLGGLVLTSCSDDDPTVVPTAQTGGTQLGITAHGVGKVTGTPDIVTVALGVTTQGPSAKAALDANTGKATEVIDALEQSGVEDKDIQTSQLSINPTYNPETGRISGYEVTNSVTATLRDFDKAGELIDTAARIAGDAVRVQSFGFSIDDDSDLRARARDEAVKAARAQAEQMANAAGVELGKILSMTEDPVSTPPPGPFYSDQLKADAALSVPIEPGSQELSLTVNVVWDINQ